MPYQQSRLATEKAATLAALIATFRESAQESSAMKSPKQPKIETRWAIAYLGLLIPLYLMMIVHMFKIPLDEGIHQALQYISISFMGMAGFESSLLVYNAIFIEEKPKPHQKVETIPPPIIIQIRNRSGYVYLLSAPHDLTLFKIGRTSNPQNRLRTFNIKLPFAVEYICTIKTDDMYALESTLHRKFASKRLDGEWFRLTSEDVDYIKGLSNG